MRLKEDYMLAKCCRPRPDEKIRGYCSHDSLIKVHKSGCPNLAKAEPGRLVHLEWEEIIAPPSFRPGLDYEKLDQVDFRILKHHSKIGVDYSLKVARVLHLDRQTVFDCHDKLHKMGLVQRVEARMIQYRKNIVKGKWIKHRNHTYYDLTEKGYRYLDFHDEQT